MRSRVLALLIGLLLAVCAARAQGMFDLRPGESVSEAPGQSTITMIVDAGASHQMYFREQRGTTAPVQVGGTYKVTATKGGETHARLTVQSLVVGGGDAKTARALGLRLKLGDVIVFSIRLQREPPWNLTVFDGNLKPVLSRDMRDR